MMPQITKYKPDIIKMPTLPVVTTRFPLKAMGTRISYHRNCYNFKANTILPSGKKEQNLLPRSLKYIPKNKYTLEVQIYY